MTTSWRAAPGRWIRGEATALLLVLGTVSSSAPAQTEAPRSPAAATEAVQRLPGTSGALRELAAAVGKLEIGEPSMVVVAPVEAPLPMRKTLDTAALEDLRQEIRLNVASVVPLAKLQIEKPLTAPQARTQARRAGLPLVLIAPSIRSSDIELDVTVTKWPDNFWRRALDPGGSRTERLRLRVFSESIRRLFPVARKIAAQVERVPSPIGSPLSLACGDLDDEGSPELVIVGRHSIQLGSPRDGRFQTRKKRNWNDLAPIHGSPLRAALAHAIIHEGGVLVGSSDRSATVHLDHQLDLVGFSPRGYPISQGTCLPYTATGLDGTSVSCATPSQNAPSPSVDPVRTTPNDLEAFAHLKWTASSGISGEITSKLPVGSTTLQLEVELPSEAALSLEIENAGSAAALADLDGDGTVEVIVSHASEGDEKEQLRVLSLRGRQLETLAELDIDPISSFAVCPFTGQNPLTLVVATEKELWIIR